MIVPPFLFVRHGETDWNAAGRLQGGCDIDLNETGRRQACEAGRRLARFFAQRGGPGAAAGFVASPLTRARVTAGLVGDVLRLPPDTFVLDERLRELSFGAWEGRTWPELKARDPAALKQRRRDKWAFVPPGGESYAMLAERVAGWLAGVNENVVAVSHGGVARVLMVLAGGASPLAAPDIDVPQGRVLSFARRSFALL